MTRFAAAPRIWRLARLVGDLAIAVGAFYAAFALRIQIHFPFTQFPLPPDRIRFFGSEWWVAAASQVLVLYLFGFYDPPPTLVRSERGRRLLAAVSAQGVGLMGFYFLTDRQFPRSVLLLFVALDLVAMVSWRSAIDRVYRTAHRRVALVGCGAAAVEVAEKIAAAGAHGVELAGWVPSPDEPEPADPDPALGARLGAVDDLPGLLAAGRIDDIILAGSARPWQTRLLDRLSESRPWHSNVLLLPGPVESLIGRMQYKWIEDLPLVEVVRQSEHRVTWPLKRIVDLTAGSVLVVVTLPLMIACAAGILVASPGPVLYRQTRIGRGRRPFTLWKFRTMRPDAERETGEVLASPGDPRLISIGAALRGLRLDELPQLFNVLSGSMSLVGPRPERPGFVERYLQEVPGYAERFSVSPGLTGLAQVNGDYHSSAENKLRYDLAYIANWSLWLDLSILVRTAKIVLTSRGV